MSDGVKLEKRLTKSRNTMLFRTSTRLSPKIPGQLMPMIGVISGVVRPNDKTKSNHLATLKIRIFSKCAVSF